MNLEDNNIIEEESREETTYSASKTIIYDDGSASIELTSALTRNAELQKELPSRIYITKDSLEKSSTHDFTLHVLEDQVI